MEANQQKKILIGVGSVVGALVLYLILAWSISFWPFSSQSKQEIFDDLSKITFENEVAETNTIFSKTATERKKFKEEFIDKKVNKLVELANKLITPKITEGDKTTSYNSAVESLKKITDNQKSLVEHNDDFWKADTNKTAVQNEIKIIIEEYPKFKTQIKTALDLK
ncbi:Immunodominant membrane protein [Candidatus Phytoplasma mali]|uniref:Immunodominant membrane protein n=2 Tax=Apple proliferation phytoplasma TaxID=37692 RepID=B3R073_PHYMT|nr:immunodominant membrane protein [Candidatus Phytoplasma mali]AXJ14262.1 immunodominant membrane protein [Candidatus Phytoplasma mali]CAA09735.1 immunodominant protein [Candidatus Phytoplasma mali]CAP18237.1 Immunodominant membrane protein [Candidatus Phytoplasma mali]CBI70451.1 immunodominant membrane protein [Candidatus Phytoplasma mali]CBJ16996.1 immunodominant membrane protein [Candidatus Phytoplasma mali]